MRKNQIFVVIKTHKEFKIVVFMNNLQKNSKNVNFCDIKP